jgi:hypothetical protein
MVSFTTTQPVKTILDVKLEDFTKSMTRAASALDSTCEVEGRLLFRGNAGVDHVLMGTDG